MHDWAIVIPMYETILSLDAIQFCLYKIKVEHM